MPGLLFDSSHLCLGRASWNIQRSAEGPIIVMYRNMEKNLNLQVACLPPWLTEERLLELLADRVDEMRPGDWILFPGRVMTWATVKGEA